LQEVLAHCPLIWASRINRTASDIRQWRFAFLWRTIMHPNMSRRGFITAAAGFALSPVPKVRIIVPLFRLAIPIEISCNGSIYEILHRSGIVRLQRRTPENCPEQQGIVAVNGDSTYGMDWLVFHNRETFPDFLTHHQAYKGDTLEVVPVLVLML